MDTFVNDKFYETRDQLVEEINLLSDAQFNRKPDKSMEYCTSLSSFSFIR